MNPLVTQAFADIRRGFMLLLRNANDAAELVPQLSQIEFMLTHHFKRLGLDVDRLAAFTAIMTRRGYQRENAELVAVFIKDMVMFKDVAFRQWQNNGYIKTASGLEVGTFYQGSLKEIMQNIATGLKQQKAVVFRRYAHNNHLLAQIVRSPEKFVPKVMLDLPVTEPIKKVRVLMEEGSTSTTSITDATINVFVHLGIRTGGEVRALGTGPWILPVTIDSKVVKFAKKAVDEAADGADDIPIQPIRQPLRGYKTRMQQFQEFVADRFLTMGNILAEINAMRPPVSAAEKREFLEQLIPAMFNHQVFTTKDFVDHGGSIQAYYAKHLKHLIDDFGAVQYEAHKNMRDSDYDLCIEILSRHIDKHFGGGEFINRHSDMNYWSGFSEP
ncbi:hypothetical protein [Hydrogenophaga sp. 5NK40-0174]|uniref:hypothetical protein n=1 Tax=Hydrogenophaga sp. 5NK40-0174 TaxID=3127649 RepID=UPI003107B6E2